MHLTPWAGTWKPKVVPRRFQPSEAYSEFCSARQAANLWLDIWLNERPDPDLAFEEVRGSINAVRDVARLRGIVLK
jgi:hypothetical protein